MRNKIKKTGLTVLTVILLLLTSRAVLAQQEAMITFRLDDGLTSQYDYARLILGKYNFPATLYIFTDPPEQGNWIGYMNWAQIEELHNVYGWEVGSHTKSHPDLTKLSNSKLIAELRGSKRILKSHGFDVKSFATPFGLCNNRVLEYIARFYQSHASAWPYGFNFYPFSDYAMSVQEVRNSTSLKTIKNWINEAVSEKKWLILLFHGIVESNPSEYEYSEHDFESVVDYVNTKKVPVVTISQALAIPSKNLIPNPSFESLTGKWANNWVRTDNSRVIVNTKNKGCFPKPTNSLRFVGGLDTYTVYTEKFIKVEPGKTYLLKVYFNCQNFALGGVDVFFDEYDSQGNWLSWKWQTGIWSEYVGYKAITYSPSQNVDKVRILIKTALGSDLTCYIDNVVFADISIGDNSPPVITSTPVVTATANIEYLYDVDATDADGDVLTYSLTIFPTGMVIDAITGRISWTPTTSQFGDHQVTVKVSDGLLADSQSWSLTVTVDKNLIPNPSFESTSKGWADHWLRTDTTHIVVDTKNNGCLPYPTNSLKFIGGPNTYRAYTEDFIEVKPGKTYIFEVYFNCQKLSGGGVDIFFDEYDSQGNWLNNWTWQTGIWTEYVGYKTVTYTLSPTASKLLIWIQGETGDDSICYVDNLVLRKE